MENKLLNFIKENFDPVEFLEEHYDYHLLSDEELRKIKYEDLSEILQDDFKDYLLEKLNSNGACCSVCGGEVSLEDDLDDLDDFIGLKHCVCEDGFDNDDCFDCTRDCWRKGLTKEEIENYRSNHRESVF
ncbi:MAG: hypothetical protein ACRC0V_04450 [Fusobacteriaceae bacterium]